ncbi:MAG: nucleotide exchange factor GrpE [Candidatus Peribacteraceae bacterium]|nr:nucleotide exchange factor GrpE [Candidatus Peribacteraceae bacterium]
MEAKAKKPLPQDPVVPPAHGKPATPRGDVTALQREIAELQAQVKRLTDMAGRAQADLQNAKARLDKDAEDLRKYAAEGAIRKLLPVIDNFQRAFLHLPEDLKSHEWVKGVAAIEQHFLKIVSDLGLRKMEVLGKPVDASRHDVLMQGPGANGTVIEVFEEGYELNGRVIRPAKVKAGDGTSSQS